MKATQMNIRGRLFDLSKPRVMGVINCSSDSFYTSCGNSDREAVLSVARRHIAEGAAMLDLGGCSTRPGSVPVSEEEELQRILPAIGWIREEFPDVPLSIDTFRASVAREAVRVGADVVNDVSGGQDEKMFQAVADMRVPYILTCACALQEAEKNVLAVMIDYLQRRIARLTELCVADVVVDPGFGFQKTLEQNYQVLRQLPVLDILEKPLLVGLSRKSMLYKLLGAGPEDMQNATTVANTLALAGGAKLLRVHDVKPAVEAITIFSKLSAL